MGFNMTILFDFDEVFVDTITGSLEYINKNLGTNYTREDVKTWDFFENPDVKSLFFEFLALPDVYQTKVIANKDIINLCKQLIEMGEDVYIVTASFEASHASKLQFIRDHMSFIDESRVYVVNPSSKYKHKSDVLDDLPLDYHTPIVLVDDGIHNVLDMMADIRHKDKLDRTMRQFYSKKSLQKFNNRYHDYIYGIIPELIHNRDIEDGKRIFKIKNSKDVWRVLKNIKESHSYRISSKQYEIFNYLHNILEPLNESNSQHVLSLQHNLEYLMNFCYGKKNSNTQFLTEVGKLSLIVKNTLSSHKPEQLLTILDTADSLFSSIVYTDISNLVKAHSLSEHIDEASINESLSAYSLNNKTNNSVLNSLMSLNERNVYIADSVLTHLDDREIKNYVNTLLFNPHTGINNIDCLSDKNYMRANLLLILNKNCDVKDAEIRPIHVDIEALASALNDKLHSLEANNSLSIGRDFNA